MQSAKGPNVLAFLVIFSSVCVSYRRSAQKFWMVAECSSWWVHSPPLFLLQLHRMTSNLDLNLFWGAVACMWGYAVFTFTSHVMSHAAGSLPWSLSDQLRFCWRPGGELSLRFSSTVTLSIGSTGCNFSILLAEIPVSLWSSLPGPENDTDAREVFEVRNCRSSSAIIEQFELWSLARGAALFLLFLRYVQTPELLLVECFSKCWSACVRHVMLGLICVCFWVCVVHAGGPRIHRMSTSCQWIVGQQQCSCPASDKEQLSSQKLFGPCKWVLWTSELFFCPKSDF